MVVGAGNPPQNDTRFGSCVQPSGAKSPGPGRHQELVDEAELPQVMATIVSPSHPHQHCTGPMLGSGVANVVVTKEQSDGVTRDVVVAFGDHHGALLRSPLYTSVKMRRASEVAEAWSGSGSGTPCVPQSAPSAATTRQGHPFHLLALHFWSRPPWQSSTLQSGGESGQQRQPLMAPLAAHWEWPLSPPQSPSVHFGGWSGQCWFSSQGQPAWLPVLHKPTASAPPHSSQSSFGLDWHCWSSLRDPSGFWTGG